MQVWFVGVKGSPKARTAVMHANPRIFPGFCKQTLSVPKGSVGGGLTGTLSRISSVVARWNVTYL
jgi:hypothetical protein